MAEKGVLFGVSVGVGDPDGLTWQAIRVLQSVPVITLPNNLQRGSSRAWDIIQRWIPAQWFEKDQQPSSLGIQPQKVIGLDLPFVQDPQALEQAWGLAANLIWDYLRQGEDVAFACEGDVGLYSTFGHLETVIRQWDPECRIERIPGVCSPLAAAAALGMSLGTVDEKIAILPAMYQIDALVAALDWAEVVVLMKVKAVYQQVWDLLNQRDLLGQAALAVEIGTVEQQVWQGLAGLRELRVPYFALLIIRTGRQGSENETQ